MRSDRPPWLQRWQQADDDELLYVDQTLLVEGGLTLEEQSRLDAAQERMAEAQEAYREALEEEWYDPSLDD